MEAARIPNKLKMYRRKSGYSRKRVARLLGYSDTSMLSLFENGRALPGVLQVLKLARLYHALPHELFDEMWSQSCALERLSITGTNQKKL